MHCGKWSGKAVNGNSEHYWGTARWRSDDKHRSDTWPWCPWCLSPRAPPKSRLITAPKGPPRGQVLGALCRKVSSLPTRGGPDSWNLNWSLAEKGKVGPRLDTTCSLVGVAECVSLSMDVATDLSLIIYWGLNKRCLWDLSPRCEIVGPGPEPEPARAGPPRRALPAASGFSPGAGAAPLQVHLPGAVRGPGPNPPERLQKWLGVFSSTSR